MLRSKSGVRLFLLFMASWQPAVWAANSPTADEILQIHRTNKDRLSQLHMQLVQRYETTEASCREARKQAEEKQRFINIASQMTPADAMVQIDGKVVKGEEALRLLQPMLAEAKKEIARLPSPKPFQTIRPMELFLDGDNYQLRQPVNHFNTDEQLAAWRFADSPLSAATLLTVYRDVSIFSRSAKATPAARWWHCSADRHAYVMQKHLTDVNNVHLPPFTSVTRPHWDMQHPFDAFFSQSAEKYRVVREEEVGGRLLTVVDVAVPIAKDSTTLLAYRAWLDLKRGALPMKMYHRQNVGEAPKDQFDRWQPAEIVRTQEIRELPNGAFYPAKTVREIWQRDTDAPELSEAEWREVRAGTRPLKMVVHRRYTWDCTVVEIRSRFDEGFFVIPFPEGQALFDHDAGKTIGALELKPLVQVGQQAPPLSIAHWLDGKHRDLDSLKGQVVVLDFWGLWCGPCRSSVPKLKSLQEGFRGRPVTFISIHNAEKNPTELAARIRGFKTKSEWNFIGAIDKGRMLEDSVTSHAYGVRGFPTKVIIGPDGRIVYVDPDLEGPECNEEDPKLLAEFETKFGDLMKKRFAAVGETWPIPKGLDKAQQEAIHVRAELAFTKLQIELALNKAR